MPKTEIRKSAVKTHRKSEEARVKNKAKRNSLATGEKKIRAAAAGDDKTAAQELFRKQCSALDKAADELEKIRRYGARFITIDDPSYPEALRSCPDPPVGLYFKGSDPPEKVFGEGPFVSNVGTRDQTPYGKEMCIRTVQAQSKSSSPFSA